MSSRHLQKTLDYSNMLIYTLAWEKNHPPNLMHCTEVWNMFHIFVNDGFCTSTAPGWMQMRISWEWEAAVRVHTNTHTQQAHPCLYIPGNGMRWKEPGDSWRRHRTSDHAWERFFFFFFLHSKCPNLFNQGEATRAAITYLECTIFSCVGQTAHLPAV